MEVLDELERLRRRAASGHKASILACLRDSSPHVPMTKDFIRIAEFADIADKTVSTLYAYHARGVYGFPPADLKIGVVLFWKRATATAWSKKRR